MASFADSVIKDQKEQIKAEDDKMMRHIENQLQKEKEEEERRKKIAEDHKNIGQNSEFNKVFGM